MPPGLMSRRKSRHLVWEMGTGTGDWGLGNWNGESESASAGRKRGQPIIPIAPPESL